MTPVENLKVGHWVAIVDCKVRRRQEFPIDGRPWQVASISLPFVCLADGQYMFSLDVRSYDLQRLTTHYVKRIIDTSQCPHSPEHPTEPASRGLCPLCGTKLAEVLSGGMWMFTCRQCGFRGAQPKMAKT
jgi:hypothetical protein